VYSSSRIAFVVGKGGNVGRSADVFRVDRCTMNTFVPTNFCDSSLLESHVAGAVVEGIGTQFE
jgi:hypothetical protein